MLAGSPRGGADVNGKCKTILSLTAATICLSLQHAAQADVVVQYDAVAAEGLAPDELATNPWTRYGTPMQHTGSFLLQDNTFDDPITQSGEYLSPATPGLMNLNSGQYGVEFKARPL